MKKVRAKERGFDNLVLREPGDIFDMPDNAKAPWFEDVKGSPQSPDVKSTGKDDTPLA